MVLREKVGWRATPAAENRLTKQEFSGLAFG
jgi:hypothetical protein